MEIATTRPSEMSTAAPPAECDLAVIGGGIVGLAVARELTRRRPDLKAAVRGGGGGDVRVRGAPRDPPRALRQGDRRATRGRAGAAGRARAARHRQRGPGATPPVGRGAAGDRAPLPR